MCALYYFFSYKVREEISEKTAGAEPSAAPNPSEYRHTGSRPLAQRLTLRLGSEEKRKGGGGGGGGWGGEGSSSSPYRAVALVTPGSLLAV